MKYQVPSDISVHGQGIEAKKLKSQSYLDYWTEDQIMIISEKKTKALIFNFADNYQFSTRLKLKGKNVEVVDKMKILSTIVDSKLSWDENTSQLIKKVNARMQLNRDVHSFGASNEEMVHLWIHRKILMILNGHRKHLQKSYLKKNIKIMKMP